MTFRTDGNAVVRSSDDGEDIGIAITFSPAWAARIADALNESSSARGLRLRRDPLSGEQVEEVDVRDRRPLSDVIGDGRHVVIVGPYATAEMSTPGGRQVRSLAEGSVLPGDVAAGHARHLVDVGLAKVVEASSAAEAFEGAPTQRRSVEAAALQPPTVGHPQPGSVAWEFEQDPAGTAQRVYGQATPGGTVGVVTGSGQAFGAPDAAVDADAAGAESGVQVDRPRGNAGVEEWRDYHVAQLVAGGASEEQARAEADGLSRDEIRARYV